MRTSEIIREIQRLPIQKRFIVLEETIHSIRRNEEAIQMENAVEALYSDYKADKELTAFANIDFEGFYEAR
jgi:ribosomal protein L22